MWRMLSSNHFDRIWAVLGLAASGMFALLGAAAPTGFDGWDRVVVAAFAIAAPLAVAWAPRWAWFGALAITGGLASGTQWLAVAALGMILAVALEISRVESELSRVAVGIAITHGLLNLRDIGPYGTTAAIAAVVLVVALATSLTAERTQARRFVATFGGFIVGAALLASGLAAFAAIGARNDIAAGSDAARLGLESARDGDTVSATAQLAEGSAHLRQADRRLGAWWVDPARLVPIVGQHVEASRAATGPVAALVEASSVAIELADVDQLKLSGGAVDLSLITAMAQPLAKVEATMTQAIEALDGADSGWILPQFADQLDAARDELTEVYPDAAKAAAATEFAPDLLGANGPRRYLVVFATTAEARELGGILGSYVELEASDGRLRVVAGGSDGDLNRAGPGTIADPSLYPRRFIANDPQLFSQNWTGMPDMPRVAQAIGELYPTMGGRPIDGAVYIDPVGVAALLALAGPVELVEAGVTVDATNVVEFLEVDQYRAFDDQNVRKDFLTTIATDTFAHLLSADLPSPRELGNIFGPAARGGHLQFATIDEAPFDFLESIFLLGAFPEPDGGDFLSVVHANGSANKLDSFLHRSVDYRVRLDDDGAATSTVDVMLSADVPSGLPGYVTGTPEEGKPVGTNRVHLSIISSQILQRVLIDGVEVPVEPQEELGYQRYLVFVDVPPDGSALVSFELTGTITPGPDQDVGDYRLTLANQARVQPDDVHVLVENANDDHVIGETSLVLVEDTIVEFER